MPGFNFSYFAERSICYIITIRLDGIKIKIKINQHNKFLYKCDYRTRDISIALKLNLKFLTITYPLKRISQLVV